MATETNFRVIGKSPIRHDGTDKVTGRALYGADMNLPGMLYGKVLRSPHPHARIKSIDLSDLKKHPECKAIVTSKDLAPAPEVTKDPLYGQVRITNVLASEKVLYKGHPILAIASNSPDQAEELLRLVKIEYEILKHSSTVEEAISKDSDIIHENWEKTSDIYDSNPNGTNIGTIEVYKLGDADDALKNSEHILEREFRTKTVHQGYIEPTNGTAWWRPNDRLTIWCSSQGHFGIRDSVAMVLGIPASQITVIPMEIGGGFGGKLSAYLEPLAAVLSKKSGFPVKMTMSRSEVLEATGPTSGSYQKITLGYDSKGKINGAKAIMLLEAGAFPGSPVSGAASAIFSPYNIENVHIDGYDIVTNKPKTTAYRAPGSPIAMFAVESMMNEIAEVVNLDPVDLRILNAARKGTRRADGVINGTIGAIDVMQSIKNHPHYKMPLPKGDFVGRGISLGFCRNNAGISSVISNMLPDGNFSLTEGSVDIGGSRTAVAQQFAEVLEIPVENVIPQIGDTDTIGYTSVTGGSGVAFKTGFAAYHTANDIKSQLIKRAALIWDTPQDNVQYKEGTLFHSSDPELKLSLKQIAALLGDTGGPITGKSHINPAGQEGSYAANIIDLRVDPGTGKIEILKVSAFQDVGRAIHPGYVEGQIQGGTAQGIGWALNEEYFMVDGEMKNNSFLDYRMPTSLDLPMIDPIIIEVNNPNHPFGVKGVGESNIVPPLAAISHAVYNAIGKRVYELPMNPESLTNLDN
ncbi:MAG: oxidoreductase [Chloroflexi bacterium]|nr:oxidoreductase [Chloroflexota bacterium]